MKRYAGALSAVLVAVAVVAGQENLARLYSHPLTPPDEALERLHLKLAWRSYIPTDGRRDGLLSVQVLNDQVLVQTRSGMLVALNPADGSAQWRVAIGLPYRALAPAAINDRSVIVYNGVRLYSLDRKTGQLQWEMTPPNGPSAAPVANDKQLFLTLNTGLLDVYELPRVSQARTPPIAPPGEAIGPPSAEPTSPSATSPPAQPSASDAPEGPTGSRLPVSLFGYRPGGRLERTPLVAEDKVMIVDTTGVVEGVYQQGPTVQYRVELDSPVTAPMGQYGSLAYVATLDQHLTALNMLSGGVEWQFLTAAPARVRPAVTEEDVYVSTLGAGLHRVNRQNGQEIWRNAGAGQFLAANKTLVYARDIAQARLLIIDRLRGTTLTAYPIRDFVFPVSNEMTDRLFLAANDGSLLCLHDQAYPTPLSWQRTEDLPKPLGPTKKAAPAQPPSAGAGNDKPPER
jgi:outer membrane protein assembly factor BamB